METPKLYFRNSTDAVPQVRTATQSRLHYLDNIRCLAMLAGVFLHVGLAYGANIGPVWYVQDVTNSATLEVGFWFIHLFRMALFFFVAGFFAKLVINSKGLKYFVKSRFTKVIVPFILFMPLIVLAINSVVFFGLNFLDGEQKTLHLVAEALPFTNTEFERFRTYHLWFIYYLAMFYAATLFLHDTNSAFLSNVIRRCFCSKYSPLIVFAIIIPSHYYQSLPMPTPESLIPQLWVFGYYGVFFMYGWFFFNNQSALDVVGTYSKPLVALVLISYAVIYNHVPSFSAPTPTVYAPELKFLLATLQSFCSVSLVLLSVYGARRFLSKQNSVFFYLSKSSYTIYLVHLPIAILVQVLLAELAINVWIKYAFALGLTLAASVVCYEFIKRKDVALAMVSRLVPALALSSRSRNKEVTPLG